MYKSYSNYKYLIIVPYKSDHRFSSNFTGKGFIGVNKECGIYVLYIQTSEINFFILTDNGKPSFTNIPDLYSKQMKYRIDL